VEVENMKLQQFSLSGLAVVLVLCLALLAMCAPGPTRAE